MGAAADTPQLYKALTRLLGQPVRKARHGEFFRVAVIARDGQRCSVTVQLSTHRPKGRVSSAILRDIADRLRVPRDQIETVLDEWTPEALREHLASHRSEELKPPHLR